MSYKFSAERNVQMLIYLLKENNIRKIVASPGTTNMSFVASLQNDPFFEMFSCVDERSASYMACGLATECGEPVVITCTGATASRNYFPGLSEAFYRNLPILAVTASQDVSNAGNLSPQFIDRTQQPVDTVKLSVQIQNIDTVTDEWDCNLKLNRAILELTRKGGGPVHINLQTGYVNTSVDELPTTRVIRRYGLCDALPSIDANRRIAVKVGGHKFWDKELTERVDCFCEKYNAIVISDHSSGYKGKYRINFSILAAQQEYRSDLFDIDLLIHIGGPHADYYTDGCMGSVKEVWRVNEDGELRDPYKKLSTVFEMPEVFFFRHYTADVDRITARDDYYVACKAEIDSVYKKMPQLHFSNFYVAQKGSMMLPEGSVLHLGVSNTQRAWTFFEFKNDVKSIANYGCRGIDGALSTAIGMSLANREIVHYCALGDLTFFYDMNSLGNRHVDNNLRILLVNNGGGAEFRLYQHRGQQILGEDANAYVAGAGHFGQKSSTLVRHYAEDLGFEYISANDQSSFESGLERFTVPAITEKPMIFEVFTNSQDESDDLFAIRHIMHSDKYAAKEMVKKIIGKDGTEVLKRVLKERKR